jgi:hypothetical protein
MERGLRHPLVFDEPRGWSLLGTQFPDNLPQHAKPDFGVLGLHAETTDETAHLRIRQGGGLGVEIAAGAQRVQKNRRHAFDCACRSKAWFRRFGERPAVSGKLIQAYSRRLSKIHRWMGIPGRDVHEPVAVAERLVGQTHLLRAEQEGDSVGAEFLVD